MPIQVSRANLVKGDQSKAGGIDGEPDPQSAVNVATFERVVPRVIVAVEIQVKRDEGDQRPDQHELESPLSHSTQQKSSENKPTIQQRLISRESAFTSLLAGAQYTDYKETALKLSHAFPRPSRGFRLPQKTQTSVS